MKKLLKQFRYGEKGFTLIELLVVVAIIGILAAVAVPNVGKFIGQGKTESLAAELHNVQTAVMGMLTESTSGQLDADYTAAVDMDLVLATKDAAGDLKLSDYLTGLNTDGTIKTDCTYDISKDGTVKQNPPS